MYKRRVPTAVVSDEIEFYTECPKCLNIFKIKDFWNVVCPQCNHRFRPSQLKAVRKTHNNPSLRGFKPEVRLDEERT